MECFELSTFHLDFSMLKTSLISADNLQQGRRNRPDTDCQQVPDNRLK